MRTVRSVEVVETLPFIRLLPFSSDVFRSLQFYLSPNNGNDGGDARYPKLSDTYYSPEVPLTASSISAVHGLGTVPKRFGMTLVCTAAQAGYSVGDALQMTSHEGNGSSGYAISANATTTTYSGPAPYISPKTGGAVVIANTANWNVTFWTSKY